MDLGYLLDKGRRNKEKGRKIFQYNINTLENTIQECSLLR